MALKIANFACKLRLNPSFLATANTLASNATLSRSFASKDDVTHTGQVYDEKDYRNIRFINSSKVVNKQFAIDLIAEEPIRKSKSRVVACDGGGGPLGHPKVYINLDKPGAHSCGYCGLRFEKEDHHH